MERDFENFNINDVPVASRGNRGGRSRRRHGRVSNQRRSETFREVKGNEVMKEYSKRLDEKLFSGFSDLGDYVQKLHVAVKPVAVKMSVTTRGLGFMVQSLYSRLIKQFPMFEQKLTIHQLYRTALVQLTVQLDAAKEKQKGSVSNPDNIWHTDPLDFNLTKLVKSNPCQFAPLAGIINSAGNVKLGDVDFYASRPILPGNLQYLGVSTHNLREIVVALSNVATPMEDRLEFYNNSPLPGAVWQLGEFGPLLQNPDELMPAIYERQHLVDDLTSLKAALSHVGKRLPKYVNGGECTFDGEGSKSLLVSTDICGTAMRIPSAQPVPVNAQYPLPVNCVESFYSSEVLSDTAMYMGAICLLGEITTLRPAGLVPSWASSRAPRGRKRAMAELWDTAASALLG